MPPTAPTYADRSVIARLAAALVGVQRWQRQAGISDPAVDTFLEVLWTFPTVGGPTFAPWHRAWTDDPLRREIEDLEQGRTVEIVPRIHRAAVKVGNTPAPLLSGLLHASEIVGDNLFKAVDDARTLEHLVAVEALVARDHVELPPASEFADQPFTDFHGWGEPVSRAVVNGWRSLTQPPLR